MKSKINSVASLWQRGLLNFTVKVISLPTGKHIYNIVVEQTLNEKKMHWENKQQGQADFASQNALPSIS